MLVAPACFRGYEFPLLGEMSSETLTWTDIELQVLAQHTSEAIGIDLSEEMVGVYNAQAQSQVSTSHQSIT